MSKCFEVPVATVQSIIEKCTTYCTVKNLRAKSDTCAGQEDSEKGVKKKEPKDHHQEHPVKSGLCCWEHPKAGRQFIIPLNDGAVTSSRHKVRFYLFLDPMVHLPIGSTIPCQYLCNGRIYDQISLKPHYVHK